MTGKELIKMFKKEGWELDRINGSHHIIIKGKTTLSIPVHNNKDLPKGLLEKLLKEGGLK
jgi:predicted RNA binding protein YcfA (HicA-like mRNA interferase family)